MHSGSRSCRRSARRPPPSSRVPSSPRRRGASSRRYMTAGPGLCGRTHSSVGRPAEAAGACGSQRRVTTMHHCRPPARSHRCPSPLTPSVPPMLPEPSGAPPAPPQRARPLREPQGTPDAARAPHLNVTFSWEHPSQGAAFLQQQAWRPFISKGRLPLRAEGPLRKRDEMAGALLLPGNRGPL